MPERDISVQWKWTFLCSLPVCFPLNFGLSGRTCLHLLSQSAAQQLSNYDQGRISPPKPSKFPARGEQITQQIVHIHQTAAVAGDPVDVCRQQGILPFPCKKVMRLKVSQPKVTAQHLSREDRQTGDWKTKFRVICERASTFPHPRILCCRPGWQMRPKYYHLDLKRSLVRLLLANITYFLSHFLNNASPLHPHNLAIAHSAVTPDCLERKPSILNSTHPAVMKHMHLFTWQLLVSWILH